MARTLTSPGPGDEQQPSDALETIDAALRQDLAPRPISYDAQHAMLDTPPGWTIAMRGGKPVLDADGRRQWDPATGDLLVEGGTAYYVPTEDARRTRFAQYERDRQRVIETADRPMDG